MTSLAATEKPSGRFFSAAAMASRPPSSRAMPDRLTLVSDSVILPSFSLPTWSSSNSAALSKRGGAPRDRFVRSTTSTPPRLARAASINRPLLAGRGELPDSVTRRTSRSADQTNGLASGTSRVSSLTNRTPGTASTDATALCRPSSEKASAASVTSRPATEIRRLSRMVSLRAAVERCARSASSGSVLVQAAIAQKMTKGMMPGHHLPLHLKSPCIRVPAGVRNGEKTNPCEAVKPEMSQGPKRSEIGPANCFFSGLSLISLRK